MFPGIEEGTWTATKIREAREGEKEDLIAKQKAAMGADQDEDEGDEDDDDEGEELDEATGEMRLTVDGVLAKSPTDGVADEDGAAAAMVGEMNVPKKDEAPATPAKLRVQESTVTEAEEGDGEGDDDDDEDMGEEGVYVEDEDDEEGAVWCMKEGKVVDWGCFFALL